MVYNVDVDRIKRQICCLEECTDVLCRLQDKHMGDLIHTFALARALHIAIESIVDIGSVLIDGFIMRDPGGYVDIIDILEDERVISKGLSLELKTVIQTRPTLVRDYTQIRNEEFVPYLYKTNLFEQFIESVRRYLEEELE